MPEDQVMNVLKFYSKSISYEKDDITILKDFIDVLTRDECKNFWTKESTRLLLEDLVLKIIKSKGKVKQKIFGQTFDPYLDKLNLLYFESKLCTLIASMTSNIFLESW